LVDGGLAGIEKGLEDLRHGRVSGGYKLVARLADTPVPVVVSGSKRVRDDEKEDEVRAEKKADVGRVVKRPRKSSDVSITKNTSYTTHISAQEPAIRQAWECMARDG